MRLTLVVAFWRQVLGAACVLAALLMAPAPARAEPGKDDVRRLTADIVCTARKTDRQFGYRYRDNVTLSVRQGTVRRFVLSQQATSKQGDEQGCRIALEDLKQEAADGAIVLREADAAAGGKSRCIVRITADDKQIRIQLGAAVQEGNDCRGGDNVMYCSPRAFWADMVIDRKRSACRPVE